MLYNRTWRFDYFLIWGNGLEYTHNILDLIRTDSNFKILSIYKFDIKEDMQSFIRKVYSSDTVPFEHLITKSKYLLNTSPHVVLILVKNLNPQECYFGDGEFKHIQCNNVKELKEKIRNKYNNKIDGKRTEEHVIHASDYESQVDHILNLFNLEKKEFYVSSSNPIVKASPFLYDFDYESIRVKLSDLYISNIHETVKLEDSNQYKYVIGNKDNYKQYWDENYGKVLIEDHSFESFDKLIQCYQYSEKDEDLIVVDNITGKYIILDGVHRAAILKSKGHEYIRCALIKRNINEKINLKGLFNILNNHRYVILRIDQDFPNYKIGSDIDILIDDVEQIKDKILNYLDYYVIRKKYKVSVNETCGHIHIDIYNGTMLNIKFDLYPSLNIYKKFKVSKEWEKSILDNFIYVEKNAKELVKVKIPNFDDDLCLRYMEYDENWERTEKIKHIRYIYNIGYYGFIDKLKSVTDIQTDKEQIRNIIIESTK